jgi:tetratricopeptide (TPR) repeat protein
VSAERWQRLRQIFDAVLDSPESDRDQTLEALCGGDDKLRAEIRALLSAASTPNAFLDRPATKLLNSTLRQGTLLASRFELLAPLGQGGMGEVWKARDRQLGEDIAVKTISNERLGDAVSLARFKREIQLARKIAHPNICRVYDLFEDTTVSPPRAFLTMEFIEGETLAERLERTGPIARDEAVSTFGQIAAGVAAAHQAGVVHRDLKPANVMLTMSGSRAVVMDFGLARAPSSSDLSESRTVSGVLVGTPEYMAPEQIGSSPATPATDVYALGLILFEMLSGARPYAGGTTFESWMRRAREEPRRLSGDIPGVQRRIDEVIARCLAYEPSKRFRDASEVWTSLQSHWPIVTGGPRRVAAAAGVFVIVAIVVVAISLGWRLKPVERPSGEALKWHADAQAALAEGASLRALNDVNRAIAAAPRFAAAHGTLAEVLLDLDMPGRAQEVMLKIAAAVPDRSRLSPSDATYVEAVQHVLVRDCDGAIASVERFAQLADTNDRPVRLIAAARMLERCDRLDEAIKALADAAALDARNPAIPLRRARIMASRRQYDDAFAALTLAENLFRDRTNIEGVGEVLSMRGTFEQQQDRLDAAEMTLGKAAEVARSLDDVRQQVRVALQQAIVHRKRGDVGGANQITATALDLARRNTLDTLTLEGLFAAANVHLVSNEYSEARTLFERALAIAETYRHDEYRARSQLSLASVLVQLGQLNAAFKAIEAARPYYARIGHRRNLALADTLQGRVRIQRAEYRDAAMQFDAAVQQAHAAGDPEQETQARENLATALAGMGRLPEALTEFTGALNAHTRSGRKRAAAFALLNVADTASRLGQFQEADDAVARAQTDVPGDAAALKARVHRVTADIALRRGQYSIAAREARVVLAIEDPPSPARSARARQNLCLAEAHLGRGEGAQAVCEPLLQNPPREQAELWIENRLTVAESRVLRGDRTGAETVLSEFVPVLEMLGGHHEYWRALALLAAARQDSSDAKQALTRELRNLRLTWGEAVYNGWLRRADVRALLRASGVAGGDER